MSLHLADGLSNFATFLVPAVLLSLADRVWRPKKRGHDGSVAED